MDGQLAWPREGDRAAMPLTFGPELPTRSKGGLFLDQLECRCYMDLHGPLRWWHQVGGGNSALAPSDGPRAQQKTGRWFACWTTAQTPWGLTLPAVALPKLFLEVSAWKPSFWQWMYNCSVGAGAQITAGNVQVVCQDAGEEATFSNLFMGFKEAE